MKKWSVQFDLSNEDTCTNEWKVNLSEENGEKTIESIEIGSARQGCQGHPRTIMALMGNTKLDSVDLKALENASCPRSKSCGQVLGACLASLN